jgi:hypothetical protein
MPNYPRLFQRMKKWEWRETIEGVGVLNSPAKGYDIFNLLEEERDVRFDWIYSGCA